MKTEDTYYYEHVDSLIGSVSRIIDEIENKGYYGPEDEIELNALTDLLEQLKSLEHGS